MARPTHRAHPFGSDGDTARRTRSTLFAWRSGSLSVTARVAPPQAWPPTSRGSASRGVDAEAIELPLKKAEAAVSALRGIVPDRPGPDGVPIAVGGQSYGGRVASLAAAEPDTDYAGLVFFSYPLHAPGKPENAADRTSHWPAIRCPVLILQGEGDPFARMDLLQAAVPLLRDAELVTYPGLGHTLKPVLDDALDRTARFLTSLRG